MAGSGDLIDFSVIEGHKENIQALPSGRSAKALAQLYSPPLLKANPSPSLIQDANSKERQAFEKELVLIDEADDPLDVFDLLRSVIAFFEGRSGAFGQRWGEGCVEW
jgi:checkpoint serine/threonine-protein kinase